MPHPGVLARLLRPRSIAIVGASPDPTSIGGAPLALLDAFGFTGDVHVVSRRQREIAGRRCVASVDDLPPGIDAAILAVPRDAVAGVVDACVRRSIGGAVVFASGFAEVGPSGDEAQRGLVARAGGLALAGPNCLGLVNFVDGVPLTFGAVEPRAPAGRPALAIIAQSGAMSFALLYAAASQDIALSYVVSTGNEAQLSVEDYLEAMIADPTTRAIAILVEQIRAPARFLALARAACDAGKGLCVLHTGASARGREAARTHTGALAGDQAVIRAMLAREAVVVVDSLDELVDTGGALARCPAVPMHGGRGVAIVTDSGAFKAHALDVCERLGLVAPEPAAATEQALRHVLPAFAVPSNPVDITGHALNDPSLYATASAALLGDPAVGALVVAAMPGSPAQFAQQVDAALPVIRAAAKPVLYSVFGGQRPLPEADAARLRDAEIPVFRSAERALAAARHLLSRRRAAPAEAAVTAPIALPDTALTEHATKRLLAALGLRSPAGDLARTLAEARSIAARIGYPIVLKAQSAQLPHKTDAGGVVLGIASDGELTAAWPRLAANIATARPGLVLDGVLIERIAPPGIEVVVAARRDAQWGTSVLVGLGGIWIEALGDVRIVAADAGQGEIHDELIRLRGYGVLAGRRGQPAGDVGALVRAIGVVGAAVAATPALAELEINPLLVLPDGHGVLVLDALAIRAPSFDGPTVPDPAGT